jgi:hypothetical protein
MASNYEDRSRGYDERGGAYDGWERQQGRGESGRDRDWRDRDYDAGERRQAGGDWRGSQGRERHFSGRDRDHEDYETDQRRRGRSGFGGYSGGTYGRYGPGYGESIPGGGGYGRYGRGYEADDEPARGGYGRYGAMFGSGYEAGYVGGYGPAGAFGYGVTRQYAGAGERDWQHTGGSAGTRNYAGRGPRGYRRSDERIQEEINEALMRHPDLDASDVEVRVANGEVTLTGVVEDRRAKRLAEDLAEEIWGIDDVRNELKVRRGFLASLTGEKADERDVTQPAVRDNTGETRRSTRGSSGGSTSAGVGT